MAKALSGGRRLPRAPAFISPLQIRTQAWLCAERRGAGAIKQGGADSLGPGPGEPEL